MLSGGRSSSIVTSCVVWMSVRGMMRVGRFLSHTQTSSIATWIIGYDGWCSIRRSSWLQR